jgi:hypothetical protein
MHSLAAFGMGSSPRCPKKRLPGAYFGSKPRDFNALRAQSVRGQVGEEKS